MSDHFSGPRALAGPQCDICDFFAFPSPERPGGLVLAMDVLPRADAASRFSAAIVHRFRIRPVEGPGLAPGSAEITVDVTFDDGGHGTCAVSTGTSAPVVVDAPDGTRGDGVRVFAGLRSDPFFLDFDAMQRTLASGRIAFTDPGTPTGVGADTLGIVVELDREVLTGFGSVLATVAETVSAGPLPIRLERVGRPEVKNFLMVMRSHDPVNRDIDLRDLYNLEDPFHVGPDYREAYRTRLSANLAYLDTLDGAIGWPLGPDGAHPLTELFLADHLVVDVSRPCADDGFLEIERALLAGRSPRSCGGRTPDADVMDVLYTLLFGGLFGPPISDHVDRATRPGTATFPYLAPPNLTVVPPRPVGATTGDHQHHRFGQYQV